MLFRTLSAASMLLILPTTEVQSGHVHPTLQPDAAVYPEEESEAKGPDAGRLGLKHFTTVLGFDRHRGAAPLFLALATSDEGSITGKLRPVLDAVSRRGDSAFPSQAGELKYPFQYLDYIHFVRLERQKLSRAPAASSVIVLPLPASGWLLGTTILGGLLFGKGRQRAFRSDRQPLRYRTV